ncbi:MAG: TniQ family protein [Oceanospirillaceae bacterium]|nr:TniQ family protein [Oceanospirillaceae bacterium]
MIYGALLPDETITSFLVRQLISEGYPTPRIAQHYLWGSDNLQINSHFPSLIPWIANRFELNLDDIIINHTALNYYRPFLSKEKYQQTYLALKKGDAQYIHNWLGITANRLKEPQELRYCPVCINSDLQTFGIAYWHRQHQLYGTTQCVRHGEKLFIEKVKRRSVTLPPQIETPVIAVSTQEISPFTLFNDWVMNQSEIPHFNFDTLTDCYRISLFNRGLAVQSLSIRQAELRRELKRHFEEELLLPAWQLVFESNVATPFPQQLFYNYEYHHIHPVKHLVLMSFLFREPKYFIQAYNSVSENKPVSEGSPLENSNTQLEINRISDSQTRALANKGKSLRSIAKFFGLSVNAIKTKVLALGGSIKRRPSKLFANERREIYRKLLIGLPTKIIAEQFGVSASSVEQILTQHPELVVRRKEVRFRKRRSKHRIAMKMAIKKYPEYSRTQLKIRLNTSYLWLYKNDNKWLYLHLPPRIN